MIGFAVDLVKYNLNSFIMTDCSRHLKAAKSENGYTFYNDVMLTTLKLLPLRKFKMYTMCYVMPKHYIMT